MEVKATIDISGALNALKIAQKPPAKRKKALGKAALAHIKAIKDRTTEGIGLRGAFRPYSQEYAQFRRDKGHSTSVNLFFSGKMLSDLAVVSLNSDRAVVSFNRASERAKAEANQRTRPFMGIKPEEQQNILRIFKRELFK